MRYKGFWFYGLKNDKILQAKDLTEEYILLNCPQEYDGPFKTKEAAEKYKAEHPNLSKEYNEDLQKMQECLQNMPNDENFWDNYIQEVGYDNLY